MVPRRSRLFEVGDVELLDQREVRIAALCLLHILGDLASEADDLDRLVGAAGAAAWLTEPPLYKG